MLKDWLESVSVIRGCIAKAKRYIAALETENARLRAEIALGIEARRVETLGSTCESPSALGGMPQSPHRTQDQNRGGEDA